MATVDKDGNSRTGNWLRDRIINLLLDLLCWVLPADQTFQLTIEPVDEGAGMLATLTKREPK